MRNVELRSSAYGATQSNIRPEVERHRYVAWSLGQVCQRWQPLRCALAGSAAYPTVNAENANAAPTARSSSRPLISYSLTRCGLRVNRPNG
jgi:hypothetical protein